ncbi:MAG: FIST signal transduction protein [Ekhidna sp.]
MYIENPSTENVLKNLSRQHVNMLLVAEHSEIDIEELISLCNKENIIIAGGLFPMILYNESSLEKGAILKVIKAKARPFLIKDMSSKFIDELPEMNENQKSSLVLLDGLSPDIPNFLHTLYDKYWSNISYVGGGAGSLTLEQKPCIFTNDGFYENAGLILLSEWSTQLGVKHGWEKIAGPFVANKTNGNKIIELNWRPAFDVYKEIVEKHTESRFASSDFFDISKGFPFGIYREGQEDIVRDPIAVEEDGTLVCVGKVEENTSLNILKGSNEELIKNASLAANLAAHENPKDTFVANCISRVLYLEEDFSKELKAIKSGLNMDEASLEGILSIGEVSSDVNGYLEFFNKTTVVSSFY